MGSWLEIAQKMAQAARAGLAVETKSLNEILAERQNRRVCSGSAQAAERRYTSAQDVSPG